MQNEAARFEKGPGRGGVPWSNECRFPSGCPRPPAPAPRAGLTRARGDAAMEPKRESGGRCPGPGRGRWQGSRPRLLAATPSATAFPLRRQTGLAVRRPQGPRSCKYSQKTLPAPGLERKSHVAATGATSSHFIRRR
uniref:Uncharacterized protein n=1 Tax=Rousettus aegyptiacus TaxID=9407 RepID=A0A7J8JIN3_ROUAE|nr:hypothetical protein HJG63_010403 [Rousettus aegyptiacus]